MATVADLDSPEIKRILKIYAIPPASILEAKSKADLVALAFSNGIIDAPDEWTLELIRSKKIATGAGTGQARSQALLEAQEFAKLLSESMDLSGGHWDEAGSDPWGSVALPSAGPTHAKSARHGTKAKANPDRASSSRSPKGKRKSTNHTEESRDGTHNVTRDTSPGVSHGAASKKEVGETSLKGRRAASAAQPGTTTKVSASDGKAPKGASPKAGAPMAAAPMAGAPKGASPKGSSSSKAGAPKVASPKGPSPTRSSKSPSKGAASSKQGTAMARAPAPSALQSASQPALSSMPITLESAGDADVWRSGASHSSMSALDSGSTLRSEPRVAWGGEAHNGPNGSGPKGSSSNVYSSVVGKEIEQQRNARLLHEINAYGLYTSADEPGAERAHAAAELKIVAPEGPSLDDLQAALVAGRHRPERSYRS